MDYITGLGWLGSGLLMLCGLPQIYHSIKVKDATGLSTVTQCMWCLGCISMLIYVIFTAPTFPLILTYLFNTLVSGTTLWLSIKYRN